MEQDEGNLARHTSLIASIDGVLGDDMRPEAGALGGCGCGGSSVVDITFELDADAGMGLDVEVPGGRMVVAPVGGYQDQRVADTDVGEGLRAEKAGFTSGGGEQESALWAEPVTDASGGSAIEAHVERDELLAPPG